MQKIENSFRKCFLSTGEIWNHEEIPVLTIPNIAIAIPLILRVKNSYNVISNNCCIVNKNGIASVIQYVTVVCRFKTCDCMSWVTQYSEINILYISPFTL